MPVIPCSSNYSHTCRHLSRICITRTFLFASLAGNAAITREKLKKSIFFSVNNCTPLTLNVIITRLNNYHYLCTRSQIDCKFYIHQYNRHAVRQSFQIRFESHPIIIMTQTTEMHTLYVCVCVCVCAIDFKFHQYDYSPRRTT